MAVEINLLHEAQQKELARRKDPVKIAMLGFLLLAIVMAVFYLMKMSAWRSVNSELTALGSEWTNKEPRQNEAVEREEELRGVLAKAEALSGYSEKRFYWAPVLEDLHRTVGSDASIERFSGSVDEEGNVACSLSGVIVGASPRQAAESLRRSLQTRFGEEYEQVTAQFASLEDEARRYVYQGQPTPAARFSIELRFVDPGKQVEEEGEGED